MNFYQQKYFKPYHEIVTSPQKRYIQKNFRTPSTHKYKQTQKNIYSQRQTQQPVWEYLYNEGLKSQKQIMQKHQVSKHKIDIQCTFKPIIKQNRRYVVPSHSTFLQRNTLWLQNKIEKIVKQKQEQINKGLKECTFAPNINSRSKKTRPDKYENVIHKKSCPNQKLHKSAIKNSKYQIQEEQQAQSPKKYSYVEISRAKQMIRNELKRIVL